VRLGKWTATNARSPSGLHGIDKRNAKYLDLLKSSIEADCIGGLRWDEYELNVTSIS